MSEDTPGFPAQQQEPPGLTAPMDPQPDHGESSYVGHGRLDGKVALITGVDSGIGRAVAIAYAREGADVAFTYQPEELDDATTTSTLVEDAGRRVLALEADVRDSDVCRDVVMRTVETLGQLDVLVVNAGYQMARDENIEDMTDERIDRTIRTNLHALFYLVRAAVPHLRGTRGCIITNSSIQAYEPSSTLLDYASTKAAINNATINLAAKLGPDGIRVNAVAPGPFKGTRIGDGKTEISPEFEAEWASTIPLARMGTMPEIQGPMLFLVSPASAFVTGAILPVDGGAVALSHTAF